MELPKRVGNYVCSFVLCLILCGVTSGAENGRQKEVLEATGRMIVEWEVDFEQKTIIFDVTAATTGFVGFGLSPAGGMAGSDIVIGGIYPDGTSYFKVSILITKTTCISTNNHDH